MEKLQPCDRYEKLKLLNEAEKAYREALATYDGYLKENSFPKDADDKEVYGKGAVVECRR